MKTTIGIDIRMLSRGSKTGIEEYTCELLQNMLGIDKGINFKLFYNGWKKDKLNYEWLRLSNVKLYESEIPNRLLDISSRFFGLPKIDRLLSGTDRFFSPHIFLSGVSPQCEKIITFHDLSFEIYPEFYSSQKNFWHFIMDPRGQAERADKIIAVSNSTKQDLVEIYGIDPKKIRVICSGLSRQAGRETDSSEKELVRRKYGLPEDYILYLGTLEPRKNIISLLKAFEKIKRSADLKDPIPGLVIAGAKGWLYDDIFRITQDFYSKNDVTFTGFVEEKDKPALYGMAKIFVYPSFYEGFGFPPLEAMAQKVPVITSDISSIPEAVENAAILINPSDPDEIRQALEMVLADSNFSRKLSGLGAERAKVFDWKKCAEETLDFIVS